MTSSVGKPWLRMIHPRKSVHIGSQQEDHSQQRQPEPSRPLHNMSQRQVTDTRHNDYVGTDANINRIPGADQATSGHSYVSVFPKEGPDTRNASGVNRPDEHLPPPTGRDRPPRGIGQPVAPAEQGSFGERLTTVQPPSSHHSQPQTQPQTQYQSQPQPLPPAPDSRTVIDRDPFATPVTAGDTLTGATSQNVYAGIGKPMGGMTSKEMHHDGKAHRKRSLQGVDQYGTADRMGENVL
ncbi:hypothetical protein BC835DRAFT_719723 [Cytidiella melzeri]|nr:hypothetical protein BC835DRAFT_719723 [Cytidiella melzeri]